MVVALVLRVVGGLVFKVGVMSVCGVGVVDLGGFLRGVAVVTTSRSIISSSSAVRSSVT